jgi:hypothetical protein
VHGRTVGFETATVETPRRQFESFCLPFPANILAQFFKMEGNLVVYSDVDGLVTALSNNHSSEE